MERVTDIVIRFIKGIIEQNFGKSATIATGGEPADIMISAEIEKEDKVKVGIGISADFEGTFNVPIVMGIIGRASQDMANPDVISLSDVTLVIEIMQMAMFTFPLANDQDSNPEPAPAPAAAPESEGVKEKEEDEDE